MPEQEKTEKPEKPEKTEKTDNADNMDTLSSARQGAVGERVLAEAVRIAAQLWDTRLLAAYALGSLAHGGFSVYVSDVDLGLVIEDPLLAQDVHEIETLATTVTAGNLLLADRLSIFWGSPATLTSHASGGRFPPLDRLDLLRHGRLVAGQEMRAQVSEPTQRELIIAGAAYAVQTLSAPNLIAQLRDPQGLAAAGVRTLTKRVLFPVRFLFTARTGEIGRNQDAVEHFTAVETGPAADLAAQALMWRTRPPDPHDLEVIATLAAGLLPLYRLFVGEYTAHLREYGEQYLAGQFGDWLRRLD